MATKRKKPAPTLETGQLWKVKGAHIQILSIGKTLIDYKLLKDWSLIGRLQTTTIKFMKVYLKTTRAKLVTDTYRY